MNNEKVFGEFLRKTVENITESLEDRYSRFVIKIVKEKMYLAASNGFSECKVYLFAETDEFFTVGAKPVNDEMIKLYEELGGIARKTLDVWTTENKIKMSNGRNEFGTYIAFTW